MPPQTPADKEYAARIKRIDQLTNYVNKIQVDNKQEMRSMSKRVNDIGMKSNKFAKDAEAQVLSVKGDLKKTQSQVSKLSTKREDELAKNANQVLARVSDSMKQFSVGMKNITASTAKSSKDIITQYGKAITEDVNVNKQNMIAMSLSRTSPLFGYFAAKFIETDVFKDATNKMKSYIGNALGKTFSAVGLTLKGMLGSGRERLRDAFTKKPKVAYSLESRRSLGEMSAMKEDVKTHAPRIAQDIKGRIPEFQTGGYVRKGGLAKLHSGEVVTSTFAIKKGMSLQEQMLQELKELKIGLIGMSDRWRIALQSALMDLPFVRTLTIIGDAFRFSLTAIPKLLFGMRGGYRKYLPRSRNVFENMNSTLGLLFTMSMVRFDKMVDNLRAIAEGITGERTREKEREKTWTVFDKLTGKAGMPSLKELAFEKFTAANFLSRKSMKGAGIESLGAAINPLALAKGGAQATMVNAISKVLDLPEMQEGGITKKGILARLHPKEWVVPGSDMKGLLSTLRGAISDLPNRIASTLDEHMEEKEGRRTMQERLFDAQFAARAAKMRGIRGVRQDIDVAKGKVKGFASEKAGSARDWANKKYDIAKGFVPEKVESAREWANEKYDLEDRLFDLQFKARAKKKRMIGKTKGAYGQAKALPGKAYGAAKGLYGQAKEMMSEDPEVRERAKMRMYDSISAKSMLKRAKWEDWLQKQKEKKDVWLNKKLNREDNKFLKHFDKSWEKIQSFHTKIVKRKEKSHEDFEKKMEKSDAKRLKGFEEHADKKAKYAEKLELATEKKVNSFRERIMKRTETLRDKIVKKNIKDQDKLTDKFNKRIAKENKKNAKRMAKDQESLFARHKRVMGWYFSRQRRAEKAEMKMNEKMRKQEDKMRKKEMRAMRKEKALEAKIKREETKYEEKMKRKAEKIKAKEEMRAKKMELKMKLERAKAWNRAERKVKKQEAKIRYQEMKVKRREEKQMAKDRMIEFKAKRAEMKEQMKERRKQLKEQLKVAKEKEKARKKELWKKRKERFLNTPQEIAKLREEAKKGVKDRIAYAKEQIGQLSKVKKGIFMVGDTLGPIVKNVRKMARGVFKKVMMAAMFAWSVIKDAMGQMLGIGKMIAIALLTKGGAAVSTIGGGAYKGLSYLAARQGVSTLGAGLGVAGLATGGYMAAKDAARGWGQAGDWMAGGGKANIAQKGVSAVSSALFGTEGGLKGAARGAKKGAALGAGIGLFFPVVGPIIGGFLGTIVGGLTGLIGGKNVAKAVQGIASTVKKLVIGVGKLIMFPFKLLWDLSKKAMGWIKEIGVKAWDKLKSAVGFIVDVYMAPTRFMMWAGNKAKDWMFDKIKKIPVVGDWLAKWMGGEKEKSIGKPQAIEKTVEMARGGITTRAGLAYLHPGEVVTPLPPEVRESILKGIDSNLAARGASEALFGSRMMAKSNAKLHRDAMAQSNKQSNENRVMMSNMTNVITNSLATAGGAGQSGTTSADPYTTALIQGEIS